MLIGYVDVILVLITLFAAIVGTVANPSHRVKAAIIGCAAMASVGTIIKTIDNARQDQINRRLIVTLVQATNLPEYFSHELVTFINPLLDKTGQFVSGQTVRDSGERVLVLKKDGEGDITGALFLSRKQMNPVLYEYAVEGDVANPLRSHLSHSWSDCVDHRNECLEELSAISKLAMDIAPIDVQETTAAMTDGLSFSLTSSEAFRGSPIRIELDKAFIETLYGLRPDQRGVRILNAAEARVIDQL